MTRVKRGVIAAKRRRKILKYAKGYHWGRKSKERLAHDALLHAWSHAFQHRKKKKGEFRALWNAKIGSAASQEGFSYSRLMSTLSKKKVSLNRKMLATIAERYPETFKQILEQVK